ncbi:MAG: hypothetical protein OSB29_13095, partial [Verrucomicrobiota bacterium]|nr:hypothetical protein [Verrucomicrobiota bacterium]
KLAESTFTGGILSLVEHDDSYSISLDGKELMPSRAKKGINSRPFPEGNARTRINEPLPRPHRKQP